MGSIFHYVKSSVEGKEIHLFPVPENLGYLSGKTP